MLLFLVDYKETVLVLFGGGLSMASLIMSTGLAEELSKITGGLNLPLDFKLPF